MSNDDGMDGVPDRCVRESERMTHLASDIKELRRQAARLTAKLDAQEASNSELRQRLGEYGESHLRVLNEIRSELEGTKELRGQVDYLLRAVDALISAAAKGNEAQWLRNALSTGRPPHG